MGESKGRLILKVNNSVKTRPLALSEYWNFSIRIRTQEEVPLERRYYWAETWRSWHGPEIDKRKSSLETTDHTIDSGGQEEDS